MSNEIIMANRTFITKNITFISNCNSEIEEDCFNFKSFVIKDTNINCIPLTEELGIDNEHLTSQIDDIHNNKANIIISIKNSILYKISTDKSQSKNYTLRMLYDLSCNEIKDEILGLYYQSFFSKSKHIDGICKVYNFGKYIYRPTKDTQKIGVYAFLEYLPDTLHNMIQKRWNGKMSIQKRTERARVILNNSLEILDCIHNEGYVHLDLHPGNIMMIYGENDEKPPNIDEEDWEFLKDTKIKLIDFGCMKRITEDKNTITSVGTKETISPYWLDNNITKYNPNFDKWSLGAIIYYCIFGTFPKRKPFNNLLVSEKKNINTIQDESLKLFLNKIFFNKLQNKEQCNNIEIYANTERDHCHKYTYNNGQYTCRNPWRKFWRETHCRFQKHSLSPIGRLMCRRSDGSDAPCPQSIRGGKKIRKNKSKKIRKNKSKKIRKNKSNRKNTR